MKRSLPVYLCSLLALSALAILSTAALIRPARASTGPIPLNCDRG